MAALPVSMIVELRDEIRTGHIAGPRLTVAGAMIDGPLFKPVEILTVTARPTGALSVNQITEEGQPTLEHQEHSSTERRWMSYKGSREAHRENNSGRGVP